MPLTTALNAMRTNGTLEAFDATYDALMTAAEASQVAATTPEHYSAAGVRAHRSALAAFVGFGLLPADVATLAKALAKAASTPTEGEDSAAGRVPMGDV